MKTYRILVATWLVAISIIWSEGAESNNIVNWSPNTEKLDLIAKYPDPNITDPAITLARDVKRFYGLLRGKQWLETYELRARAFRKDFPKSDYLVKAKDAEKTWGLINYEILSVKFSNSFGSTNFDEAVLICKFVELPENATSYSTVFWHKEDGIWRCLSAGPVKLDIFNGTRTPVIDWR